MSGLLKFAGVVTLSVGIQFVYVQSTLASLDAHHPIQSYNYEPPNTGGPDSSRGCGTR